VRNGLGLAQLPRAGSDDDGVLIIDVEDAELDLFIAAATPSDGNPSTAHRLCSQPLAHAA
jgi:hypothetical protein